MSIAAQSIRSTSIFPDRADEAVPAELGCGGGLWNLGLGVRGVLELAEESRDEEGDLFADVDRVVADALDRARGEQHRHRPLAAVGVVADLEREPEGLLVQV